MFVLTLSLAAAVLCGAAETVEQGKGETKPASPVDRKFPAEMEAAGKAAAEKLALGLAESLKSGDFAYFEAAQPQGDRRMPKETFAKMRARLIGHYGNFAGAEYFGRLDQGRVMDFLWKLAFEGPQKAPGTREIIFWVRVGAADGKPVIAGFSFYFN
jgi:hypothetical protein